MFQRTHHFCVFPVSALELRPELRERRIFRLAGVLEGAEGLKVCGYFKDIARDIHCAGNTRMGQSWQQFSHLVHPRGQTKGAQGKRISNVSNVMLSCHVTSLWTLYFLGRTWGSTGSLDLLLPLHSGSDARIHVNCCSSCTQSEPTECLSFPMCATSFWQPGDPLWLFSVTEWPLRPFGNEWLVD